MMEKAELLTVLKAQIKNSVKYANTEFRDYNKDLDDAYHRRPYNNEEEDHSQVVATDVYDTVESDMPSLARTFLGANKVMEFMPNTSSPEDIEEARQKTKYADFLVRRQKNSFKVLHDLIKEPGKGMCSVAYYYQQTVEKPRYVTYEGLSEEERALHQQELEDEADRVEVIKEEETDDGYNVQFRAVTQTKLISIMPVALESFIMTRGAVDKDSAMLVGHEVKKTKGKLVAEGYDAEMVKRLPVSEDAEGDFAKQRRFEEQGGYDPKTGYHWTNDEVLLQTLFPLVDFDDDGIPERRMIVKCGEEIFENEPFGHVPYAIFSQILEPHSAIGRSRGEIAAEKQKEKTALKRAMMNNTYEVGAPRVAVDDSSGSMDGGKVNLDDLFEHEFGGVVRVDGVPQNALMPLEVPYIGDKTLQVIQYLDSEKAVSLGTSLANQGLDSDQLYKETATRFEGVQEDNAAKVELVARAYAETGFRELYEGVIWLAQHYQDDVAEFMALGEEFKVDPRDWKVEHYCSSQVGLGAGDSEQMVTNLTGIVMNQLMLIERQSPLADWAKVYNALDDLVRLMGKPDTSRYYNNPEVEEETLFAQNIQLAQMVQMLQQQIQQNPLAEAELIKAQAKMAEVRGKESNAMTQFLMSMQQENQQFAQNMAAKLTEMELKYEQDVPGALTGEQQADMELDRAERLAKIRKLNAETEQTELDNAAVRAGLIGPEDA